MRLVDTNIVAYLLVYGERSASARALLDIDPDWHSESYLVVELTNVLATQVRARRLSLRQATSILIDGQALITPGLHLTGHSDALALAAHLSISAYDARFLALSIEMGAPLITEDAKLRKAAPSLTQSLADALATA